MVRLSKSKILCYEKCPYQFKKINIDKIKIEYNAPAMQRGSENHEVFDKFYDTDKTTIEGALQDIKDNKKVVVIAGKTKRIQHIAGENKEILDNFIQFNKDIGDGKNLIKPILKEKKCFDLEINTAGVIDAVFEQYKDILVLDYKTGKQKHISNYFFELALYAYLIEKVEKIKPTHYGIWFADTGKLVVEPINPLEITKALLKIRKVRAQIQQEKFDKKFGWWCTNCLVKQNDGCDGSC